MRPRPGAGGLRERRWPPDCGKIPCSRSIRRSPCWGGAHHRAGRTECAGEGWAQWDIAAFTMYLACFARLAAKAAKTAKLFNAVQKARVSWGGSAAAVPGADAGGAAAGPAGPN